MWTLNILRGMIVPESRVLEVLNRGGQLGPDTCGWHYVEGLSEGADPGIAILWCKEVLGHNGQRSRDGGRQVLFVDGAPKWIPGKDWTSFLKEQEQLLANRSPREKASIPLVNAILELPDGSRVKELKGSYRLETKGPHSDHGTASGSGSF